MAHETRVSGGIIGSTLLILATISLYVVRFQEDDPNSDGNNLALIGILVLVSTSIFFIHFVPSVIDFATGSLPAWKHRTQFGKLINLVGSIIVTGIPLRTIAKEL